MESVQSSAVIICIAAAVIAIINNFVPAEKFRQPMRLLLSAFAVLALLVPVRNVIDELPDAVNECNVHAVDYNQKAVRILSEQTSAQIKNMLESEGIKTDVTAEVKIDSENGIYIQSVRIDINIGFKSREQEIRELILKKTGTEPQIVFKSEE